MNEQAPEKQDLTYVGTLVVHSIFPTIQGEGPFVGIPCVFVRLAGCNLQCPMCDTEYTSIRQEMTYEQIIREAIQLMPPGNRLIVLTGGEPFRQNIVPFLHKCSTAEIVVQIETNGSLWVQGMEHCSAYHRIVCSPKAGKVNKHLIPHVNAWKYVGESDNLDTDGLPLTALRHTAHPRLFRPPLGHPAPVYLQAADAKDEVENERNLNAVVASCMKHGHRLCLQVHKYIGVP